jgi:cytochrome b
MQKSKEPMMTIGNARFVPVWDLPTRVFHWSLVVLVLTNLAVEPRGSVLAYRVHVTAGYLIAALIVFRLVWGVIGSKRARFADFVAGWATVRTYARRLVRLDPPHSVGHNPLGGWMIVVLLGTLGALILTGLVATARRVAGPLAYLVPTSIGRLIAEVHEFLGNALIALIAIHIAGVILDMMLGGGNLVRAMFTGRKRLDAQRAAAEPALASPWPAALMTAALAAAIAWALMRTNFTSMGLG